MMAIRLPFGVLLSLISMPCVLMADDPKPLEKHVHENVAGPNAEVNVSGKAFSDCTFTNCTIIIPDANYEIDDACTFQDCVWKVTFKGEIKDETSVDFGRLQRLIHFITHGVIATPRQVMATDRKHDSIQIDILERRQGLNYVVQRKVEKGADPNPWVEIFHGKPAAADPNNPPALVACVDRGLSAGTKYRYRVKASDDNGNESDWSPESVQEPVGTK